MFYALGLTLLLVSATTAFVPASPSSSGWRQNGGVTTVTTKTTTSTARSLLPSSLVTDAWNTLTVATIDGDISKLSDNEFAPVFAGGIAVMFGGLLSALVVGSIVDRQDLSASIVADSYAQANEDMDEAFWKGLSEEEKKKTQELLRRIKESKGEKVEEEPAAITTTQAAASSAVDVQPAPVSSSTEVEAPPPAAPATKSEPPKKVGMFDDYGD